MSNKIGDLSLCDKHYGEYAHNHESVEWFEGLGVCQICLQNRINELQSENQLAWNTCDEAETKTNKLEADCNRWITNHGIQMKRAIKAEAKLAKVRPYLHHDFHCVWHEANCADKCICGFQQALQEQKP